MLIMINNNDNDLKSNSYIQKYLYKIVMICIQTVSITWSKLISGGAVIYYSRCQTNFRR